MISPRMEQFLRQEEIEIVDESGKVGNKIVDVAYVKITFPSGWLKDIVEWKFSDAAEWVKLRIIFNLNSEYSMDPAAKETIYIANSVCGEVFQRLAMDGVKDEKLIVVLRGAE